MILKAEWKLKNVKAYTEKVNSVIRNIGKRENVKENNKQLKKLLNNKHLDGEKGVLVTRAQDTNG